jgi:hypothetical protein
VAGDVAYDQGGCSIREVDHVVVISADRLRGDAPGGHFKPWCRRELQREESLLDEARAGELELQTPPPRKRGIERGGRRVAGRNGRRSAALIRPGKLIGS